MLHNATTMYFFGFVIWLVLQTQVPTLAEKPSSFNEQLELVRKLPDSERNIELSRLAVQQAKHELPVDALKTLSFIDSPAVLGSTLGEIRLIRGGGSDQSDSMRDSSAGVGETANGGLGGASLADFTALIDLIQTTVSPDTWEALGGPSTMREYVAGIYVDGEGLVQDVEAHESGTMLDNIDVMLSVGGKDASRLSMGEADAWRLPSDYRCVSLSQLSIEIVQRRLHGVPVDDAMRNLAGLSRVQYVVIDQENSDVILVGPVGGIERREGWWRDLQSGKVPMQLEYFVAAASSILSSQPFGCTIDPTQDSLAAAADIAKKFQNREIAIGMAAEAVREAIGNQDVRIFGIAGDSPLGYLLVEADRHMKQLALGIKPMPAGAPNYLQIVSKHISQGAPDGQLLRLWFEGSPMAVRVDSSQRVYELAGRPIKLGSETRLATGDGGRMAAPPDFRVTEFVSEFNRHYDDIVSLHPVYGALESVYRAAAIAELLRRSETVSWLPQILGPMLLDNPASGTMQTPRKVASIATLHQVTHGRKRHAIVVASGGVVVETRDTLEAEFRPYDAISTMTAKVAQPVDLASQPDAPTNSKSWWWNAR